jgi:hypothetical protein
MASAGTSNILLQSQQVTPLSRQSATEAISENTDFHHHETKQYSLKIIIALFTGSFWP